MEYLERLNIPPERWHRSPHSIDDICRYPYKRPHSSLPQVEIDADISVQDRYPYKRPHFSLPQVEIAADADIHPERWPRSPLSVHDIYRYPYKRPRFPLPQFEITVAAAAEADGDIPPQRRPSSPVPLSVHDICRTPYKRPHFSLPQLEIAVAAAADISAQRRPCSPPSVNDICSYPYKRPHFSLPPLGLAAADGADSPFTLSDVRVEVGTLLGQQELHVAWEGPETGLDFTMAPGNASFNFCFPRRSDDIRVGDLSRKSQRVHGEYKLEFFVRDITELKYHETRDLFVILLRLSSSPCVWHRANEEVGYSRTVDFTPNGAFGRSDFYKFSIPLNHGNRQLRLAIENYLKQQRAQEISIQWPHPLPERPFPEPPHPFFCIGDIKGVCFEVMFLVNAVMHKGIFNQHQLKGVFFNLLRQEREEVNVASLNYIYSHSGGATFDACQRLRDVQMWFSGNPSLLHNAKELDDNIAHVRRIVITPTKAYCIPPEAQLANRVLRRFKHVADRFLRVTFTDEGMQTISRVMISYGSRSNGSIFKRVKTILSDGFDLCGRKYSFLAFSSNQLREGSAWFFAGCNNFQVDDIRTWMGKFTDRNVAKYAARQGQCFSSTYATVAVPSRMVNHLPDIERNGYNFSDGIGKISPDFAMEVAKKLKLERDPPSAYQIRYGGCKGVIACWPPSKEETTKLSLRPSMKKFESQHETLEICSWTRFQPAFLNREIITLLSTLGVPDEVFLNLQLKMVNESNMMFVDSDVALDVITSFGGEHGNPAAEMLRAGFKPDSEPHLHSILKCLRASQRRNLRDKARILVPSGRCLMGCLDEIGVLEQGQCFIQVSDASVENCVTKSKRVIKGLVVVAKNPCHHPGDVRILKAVDAPELHHLHDCLIFPQKGHRPHSNEASGSDLDGDMYFVTWDRNLIPPSRKSWEPMEFDTVKPTLLDRDVTNLDITDFFVRYMADDNLGKICNAIVVRSDISKHGAADKDCIELAKLAAIAVDLPKTGKNVTLPSYLKPNVYPDFMGREDSKSYKSEKILGTLFRRITCASDEDMNPGCGDMEVSYDDDMEVPGFDRFVGEALERKRSYDFQLKSLMRQYNVKEEEIVTGHVWSSPNHKKRGELQEQLKHSYSALKKEFRKRFDNLDYESLTNDVKNILYEQKASAWYAVTYSPKFVKDPLIREGPDGPGDAVILLSFAWIATDQLARIKNRKHGRRVIDSRMPINSFKRNVADRKDPPRRPFKLVL